MQNRAGSATSSVMSTSAVSLVISICKKPAMFLTTLATQGWRSYPPFGVNPNYIYIGRYLARRVLNQYSAPPLRVQRGSNRPKPEKAFPKPENCYFNRKISLDRKPKPEKGIPNQKFFISTGNSGFIGNQNRKNIPKSENFYFNRKVTIDRKPKPEKGIPKPENCYFDRKITLDRKPKSEKVFPKSEKVFVKPKNCFFLMLKQEYKDSKTENVLL